MDIYLVSDNTGNIYYYKHDDLRKLEDEGDIPPIDNHYAIATYFNLDPEKVNNYAFSYFTKKLTLMKLKDEKYDDSNLVFEKCFEININDIYPEFDGVDYGNPFKYFKDGKLESYEIEMLNDLAKLFTYKYRKQFITDLLDSYPERLKDPVLYLTVDPYREYILPILNSKDDTEHFIPFMIASNNFKNTKFQHKRIIDKVTMFWKFGYVINIEKKFGSEWMVVYYKDKLTGKLNTALSIPIRN